MDLNDFELTDAQKNFLARSHKPSQKVFILPKHHGKSEAKGMARVVEDEIRRRSAEAKS